MAIQTFDIERQTDILHSEVVAEAAEITREAVLRVLKLILEHHPEINDESFAQIRSGVRGALLTKADYADRSAYPILVLGDLEENGTLKKEIIPEQIVLAESVLGKMATLDDDEEYRKIIAYIILNSATRLDVKKKLTALDVFASDASQFLMPFLHALIKINPEIKRVVRDELANLEAVKALSDVPDFLERYCFSKSNTQPYEFVETKFGDRASAAARKELLEVFVAIMLKVLKEYLLH